MESNPLLVDLSVGRRDDIIRSDQSGRVSQKGLASSMPRASTSLLPSHHHPAPTRRASRRADRRRSRRGVRSPAVLSGASWRRGAQGRGRLDRDTHTHTHTHTHTRESPTAAPRELAGDPEQMTTLRNAINVGIKKRREDRMATLEQQVRGRSSDGVHDASGSRLGNNHRFTARAAGALEPHRRALTRRRRRCA